MIFKSLEITNYGIFKGHHDLAFANHQYKALPLLAGSMEAGRQPFLKQFK